MGYELTSWNMEFVSAEKMLEYYRDKEVVLKFAVYDCPSAEKTDLFNNDIQDDGSIKVMCRRDKAWEFKEKLIWIPYVANYMKGSFSVRGERNLDDMWKVEVDGRGNWKFLKGKVVFEEAELE